MNYIFRPANTDSNLYHVFPKDVITLPHLLEYIKEDAVHKISDAIAEKNLSVYFSCSTIEEFHEKKIKAYKVNFSDEYVLEYKYFAKNNLFFLKNEVLSCFREKHHSDLQIPAEKIVTEHNIHKCVEETISQACLKIYKKNKNTFRDLKNLGKILLHAAFVLGRCGISLLSNEHKNFSISSLCGYSKEIVNPHTYAQKNENIALSYVEKLTEKTDSFQEETSKKYITHEEKFEIAKKTIQDFLTKHNLTKNFVKVKYIRTILAIKLRENGFIHADIVHLLHPNPESIKATSLRPTSRRWIRGKSHQQDALHYEIPSFA